MPAYLYCCENCNELYEIRCSMDEIEDYCGECPECSSKDVYREYAAENVCVTEGIKTVGGLADKNADKFSTDYKRHIDQKTRAKESPVK